MMWFDPYKLLANANFQDVVDIPIDPALAETPPSAPGGMTSGGLPMDALSLSAAPLGNTANAFSPAVMAATPMSPPGLGGFGADLPPPADDAQPTFYSATPGTSDTSETYSPIAGAATTPVAPTTPAAPKADTGYQTEVDKITGAPPGRAAQPVAGAGTAGGAAGAAGANAVTQFANALRGVAQAAQGGNPQAQQIMNLLRQLQQQGMLGQQGMFGGGQQYNPYMNQFNNPWESRRRMEQMRREFMERQRLRRELYGREAGRPGTAGGGRGRR